LYLLIHDEQLQAVDPDDMLYEAMGASITVVAAKQLNPYTKKCYGKLIFDGVPVAARDRFLYSLLQLLKSQVITPISMECMF
jgi:hypothetical protein